MVELGIYTLEEVERLQKEDGIIIDDCIEGCLLDTLLLYDEIRDKYILCQEYVLNEWSSVYKVYEGTFKDIHDKWNNITNN